MPPHRAPLSVESLESRDVPAASFDTYPALPTDDPAVLDRVRSIAALGRILGRRPDAFMKVGDSNTYVFPGFGYPQSYLVPLGEPGYNPAASGLAAAHPEVLDTLAAYRSPAGVGNENSFTRRSASAFAGYLTSDAWTRVGAEVRATQPAIALVMIGTNDVGAGIEPELYREVLRSVVDDLTREGVIPVLSTLPDSHFRGGVLRGRVRAFNQVIADVAEESKLPLWNVWRSLAALPNEALHPDGVHLNTSPLGGGSLTGGSLLYGQNVRNLEALRILDWLRDTALSYHAPTVAPFSTWTPIPPNPPVYAVGRDIGQQPLVSVYDAQTGQELNRFLAYDPSFLGGVQVAVADVDGDGVSDVVTTPGPGGGPVVKVFSGADGSVIASFFAFDERFRTGQTIAAADLDGDGMAEIVVGAGAGGGPAVAVFHGGDLNLVQSFFALDPTFRGGIDVAAGTFAGVGPGIAVTAGRGGGANVYLFRYGTTELAFAFAAGGTSDRGGLTVAAGDLDGDGQDEVIAAATRGQPRVRVLDPGSGAERVNFLAGWWVAPTGVRLAVIGGGAGTPGRLLAADGPGGPAFVQAYRGLDTDHPIDLPPADAARAYGLFVG